MQKRIITLFSLALLIFQTAVAQQLTTPAGGGNKKTSITEFIGLTKVTINYDRPGVKGREGKIWGALVQYGFNDLGFGTSKAAPWRAGANENTTISFSTNVKVEGQNLPAGTYGLFMGVQENETIVIFSKNSTSWGSYFYDQKEDALRVTIKQQKDQTPTEWLKYEFLNETDNSATIALCWEKWKFPFKVETDLVQTQLASFRNELRGDKGFDWKAFKQAADFCVQNNTNLDEALTWADGAISAVFIGEKNFSTLSTKAQVLNKLNRNAEADVLMKEAMPLAGMQELHQYARSLMAQKRNKEAFEAFQLNAQKNPNVFTTNMGLCRGYSAVGDYKNALKYAKMALAQAPDANNKSNIEKNDWCFGTRERCKLACRFDNFSLKVVKSLNKIIIFAQS